MAEEIGDVDSSIVSYAKTCKNGELTTEGFTKALNENTLSAKAATVATKALAMAGNMIAMCAITKVISIAVEKLNDFAHAAENAKEKAKSSKQELDQLTSEINDLNKELETTKDRIEELLEKANSGSISLLEEEELNTLREQNDELQREIALKEKLAEIDAKEAAKNAAHSLTYKTDDNKWDEEYNPTDRIDKLQGWINTANYYQEKLAGINQQILDIEKSATDSSYKTDSAYNNLINQQKKYQDEIEKAESKMNSLYNELSVEDDGLYYNGKALDGYEDLIERLDTVYMAVELYLNDGNIEDTAEECIEAIKNKLLESGLSEEISNAVADGFSEEELNSIMSSNSIDWSKCLELDDATAVIKNIKEQLASIKNGDETAISISDIFSLKDTENNATVLSNLSDQLSSVESAYNTCLAAKEEYDEQGYLSIDTLQKVLSLGDEYLQYLFDEEGNVRLDADAFQQLAQARINDMEAQALSNLAENIRQVTDEATATEYLAQKQNELASSYADVAANALMALRTIDGFADSKALQGAYNSFKTQYEQIKSLFANTRKSLSSTYTGKSESKSSKSSSDPLKDAFTQEYNTLKHNLDMEYITEKQYYDSLDALNQKYFAGKSEYLDEYRQYEEEVYKGLKSYYKDYIESQMKLLESQLDAGVINYKHYSSTVKSLLDNMYASSKISAQDYHDYVGKMLETQKSIYDKVLSAVLRRFDKEIDGTNAAINGVEQHNSALENQKSLMDSAIDAVVNYYDSLIDAEQQSIDNLEAKNDSIQEQINKYDSLISVADKVYGDEQKSLEEQQSLLQDKIDALNDENDALDLQYRKEQALIALRRAQTQRTKKIYNGTEFVYDTDKEAIREAQKNLQDIKTEELISDLEKEKNALQEAIDELQKYRDALGEISDAYEQLIDEQNTIDLLGNDYKTKILGVDILDWEKLKDRYVSANKEMADNTVLINGLNQKIDILDKEKEQWSSLTQSVKDNVNKQAAIQQFGADWEQQINEGRFVAYDDFKNRYLSIESQINNNSQMIESYNQRIGYYENLKSQWANIADVYEQSVEDQYAAMILGENWESDILSGRMDTLNYFRNNYVSIQQAIADAAWNSANAQIKAVNVKQNFTS